MSDPSKSSQHSSADVKNKGRWSQLPIVRLVRYARGERGAIIRASSYSVANKLFDIAPEILIGIAIDVVVNQEESFIAALGFVSPQSQIIFLGVLTFFVWVGESIFEYALLIGWRNLAQRLQHQLRLDAYTHVQALPLRFFENRSTGDLLAILNDDVNQLERFLNGGANNLIQVATTVLAVGGVFFIISPTIALLAFTPIPVILIGAFYFQRRAQPLYAKVREAVGQLSSRLSNNLSGIATIKAFTAERREAAALRADSDDYVDVNRRAISVSSAFIPLIRMAILSGFLCTFVVGGFMTLNGQLNVGLYGLLVFLTQRLLWPLTSLAETVDLYERAMASTRRILDLLDVQQTLPDGSQTPEMVAGEFALEAVTFRYDDESAPALKDLTLTIAAGETTAFVGTTGAGKSSLFKLLLRFYDPSAGTIRLDGVPLPQLKLEALRAAIGFVSQDVFLFHGTVAENIAYGMPAATDGQIEAAARAAEAWAFIERLPDGLQTVVGELGQKLSGGQRQRLALARALLKDPPILLLDEATSAVDNETEAAIQKSLSAIRGQRTIILIAHRLSTIVDADNIIVLDDGQIVEQGAHEALIAADGPYARLWQVQTGDRYKP